jgi:catabolite regulation protein CreA
MHLRAKVGKIELAADINKGKEGEEVFEQARSLLFKSVRIRRIYDEQARTLIYVSYRYKVHYQTWGKMEVNHGFRIYCLGY